MVQERILLIINPVAGRQKAKKLVEPIVKYLDSKGYNTTIYTTSKKDDARDIVSNHAIDYDRIIFCGGDGTFNEITCGLLSSGVSIPIGYIPTGTTNDIASTLKISQNMNKALKGATGSLYRKHDIGLFNEDTIFAYIASFGAFTKTSYATSQRLKNIFGRGAYFLRGVIDLVDNKSHYAKIIADGEIIEGDFIFGSVSNSNIIAGIIKLPEEQVKFDDGNFEIILIRKPENRFQNKRLINWLLHQKPAEDVICFIHAKNIVFEFNEGVSWTVDGEFAGEHQIVKVENRRQAIRIATRKEI